MWPPLYLGHSVVASIGPLHQVAAMLLRTNDIVLQMSAVDDFCPTPGLSWAYGKSFAYSVNCFVLLQLDLTAAWFTL